MSYSNPGPIAILVFAPDYATSGSAVSLSITVLPIRTGPGMYGIEDTFPIRKGPSENHDAAKLTWRLPGTALGAEFCIHT